MPTNLDAASLADLHAEAARRGIPRYRTLSKTELAAELGSAPAAEPERNGRRRRGRAAAPPAEAGEPVRLERRGALALIVIDDRETNNALGSTAFELFEAALDELESDREVRLVAVRGRGRIFCAGAALREYDAMPDGGVVLCDRGTRLLDRLAALPVPVAGLINGHAVGGGVEVALACDLRVISPEAELRFVQAGVGVTPGWGGLSRLRALVGPSQALRILATRSDVTAQESLSLGLVSEIVGFAEQEAWAQALAERIAGSDRFAVSQLKALIAGAAPEGLRAAERAAFLACWPNRRLPENVRA